MSKRVLVTISIITILLAVLTTARPRAIQAFDPSFPTRTPTPGPGEPPVNPTATTGGPGDPGNPGNPLPTETPPGSPGSGSPQPVQTGTAGAPGAGSPSGTAIPTVILGGTIRANPGGLGECSDTPYIRAKNRLIVYGGPGMDYGPVSTLEADEMRPIIGRAAYAQWWQIQVKTNLIGWVQDREVDEFGNTALVPSVAPPAINGATPTPGALWNPTPLPLLTCVPTPTPTPTATATPAVAGSGAATGPGTTSEQGTTSEGGEGATGSVSAESQPEMVQADIVATPVSSSQELADTAPGASVDSAQGAGMNTRGSSTSRAASPTSAMNLILPVAGVALIAAGIILALFSRSRSGKTSVE